MNHDRRIDARVCSLLLIALAFGVSALPLLAADPKPIVPPGAAVQAAASGYKFTEGPAYDGSRYLYFSDIPNSTVHRLDTRTGAVAPFLRPSGQSNGLAFDRQHRLLLCQGQLRQVARLDVAGRDQSDASDVVVLANAYDDKKLNSPNDLAPTPDGGVYFTDPRYGPRNDLEQPHESVYYINPDHTKVIRVIDDLVRPNGIALSPDAHTLYVGDNGAARLYAYHINPDATLADKTLLLTFNHDNKPDTDGMAVDAAGNIYIASPNTSSIWIIAPAPKPTTTPENAARVIAKIPVPKAPANCILVPSAEPGREVLYITAVDTLYRITLNDPQ